MRRSALNTSLRVFKDEPLFMSLEVWGVDFDTWSVFKMPLSSFVRTGLYSKYSLVLLGPPRTAKTPCAESLAALLALAEQSPAHEVPEDERKEPYYLRWGPLRASRRFRSTSSRMCRWSSMTWLPRSSAALVRACRGTR